MQQIGTFLKIKVDRKIKLLLLTLLNNKKDHTNKVQVIVNNNT